MALVGSFQTGFFQLENCVDDATVKRYAGNIDIVE
jgi:hypothetical protein